MNPSLRISHLVGIFLAVALTAGIGVAAPDKTDGASAGSTPSTSVFGPLSGADLATHQRAVGDAKTAGKKGDVDGVERAVTRWGHAKAGTPAADIETAGSLAEIAGQVSRDGDPKAAKPLIDRAFTHLRSVEKKSKDPKERAQAKRREAFLHQRFTGDIPAAIQAYKDALAEDPDDKGLSERLAQLEEMDAILRARLSTAKGGAR